MNSNPNWTVSHTQNKIRVKTIQSVSKKGFNVHSLGEKCLRNSKIFFDEVFSIILTPSQEIRALYMGYVEKMSWDSKCGIT